MLACFNNRGWEATLEIRLGRASWDQRSRLYGLEQTFLDEIAEISWC
jgi:hypothetical protein